MRCHSMSDSTEPNLFRELFPYTEPPRIRLDHPLLAPSPAREMFVTDSTFREGQQARPPFTPEEVGKLFDALHRLSGPERLIRHTEFFLYSDRDRHAVNLCLSRGYDSPAVTGWIRPTRRDLVPVLDAGLRETGILTSASDYHIYLKLGLTRREAADRYLRVVRLVLEKGIVPRCGFEDITRADVYGFCIPFAIELMKLREESGMDVKIRLSDTLGLGVTYPGVGLPRGVPALVRAFVEEAGVPGHLLEWHGHNDFHHGLINSTTAWLYGCGGVCGTWKGWGERTGTAPIEVLLAERLALSGLFPADRNGHV
ncbi:pyruvate carboxyltransferase [Syntrophobacter fumaroxidans]|uniref:Pyruvate carboxyltransferase n=1 Tax=Syntrophobacter fumaroxidans (strain DSM 10017 / MPOB) TaxID=335543 RepID=A0LH01_SYNFM|nr:pyruvate carboxyltransferase [Syntrophobacter fumaroxidans]ABK16703.1 pyruvate carboxyltransferase [Syntrophobacter fumaroxidans MPOB]